MTNEIDRIQNAIRHIESSLDVDDWAMEIAVKAMQKQIPKNPVVNGDRNEVWTKDSLICPVCNQYFGSVYNVGYCRACGQKLIQKRISVV